MIEAEAAFRESRDKFDPACHDDGEFELIVLNSRIANACLTNGRLDEAVKMHAAALTAMRKLKGNDDKATFRQMIYAASAYEASGKWEKGLELRLEGLGGMTRLLGEENVEVLNIKGNLAGAYAWLERWTKPKQSSSKLLRPTTRSFRGPRPGPAVQGGSRNTLQQAREVERSRRLRSRGVAGTGAQERA